MNRETLINAAIIVAPTITGIGIAILITVVSPHVIAGIVIALALAVSAGLLLDFIQWNRKAPRP